jgi:hypothetical protein
MAQGFRTPILVRGKEPLLRRMVCEVRYQDGYLYLDHCGRLVNSLLKQAPEWVVAPEPTPQGTTLYNLHTNTQLAFSSVSASLSLDKSSSDEFIDEEEKAAFKEQVEASLGLVLGELEVTEFRRIGYREHHYFSFDSKEESEKWLVDLGLMTVAPELHQAFQAKLEGLGVAFVLEGEDCRYRVALNGIERSAQIPIGETTLTIRASAMPKNQRHVLIDQLKKKRQRQINSAFAVLLDIDAYLLEPEELNLAEFVEEHGQQNVKRFKEALPKGPSKKGKKE